MTEIAHTDSELLLDAKVLWKEELGLTDQARAERNAKYLITEVPSLVVRILEKAPAEAFGIRDKHVPELISDAIRIAELAQKERDRLEPSVYDLRTQLTLEESMDALINNLVKEAWSHYKDKMAA